MSYYLRRQRLPLPEPNPAMFWKSVSLGLLLVIVYLLDTRPAIGP